MYYYCGMLKETYRPSQEIVVQKMFKRYGEELVMLWWNKVVLKLAALPKDYRKHYRRL